MKTIVPLVLLAVAALALVPASLAAVDQIASAHALSAGKAFDLSFNFGQHKLTVRSCDLTTRTGSFSTVNYTTVRSSQISVPNPLGGARSLGVHLEANATLLSFAGDFLLVNDQFLAIDGTGADHTAGDQALVAVPLPTALVPTGLPFC